MGSPRDSTTIAVPKVGVGVFVLNQEGQFLLGKRAGSHGHGTWALPGGHLEAGESFEDCAAREVLEETNLKIQNIRFLTATNDVMVTEGKHYVTIWVACEMVDVQAAPENLEPEKCEKWEWVNWVKMKRWAKAHEPEEGKSTDTGPRTLFLPLLNLIAQRPHFEGPGPGFGQ
ncbi:NUDIX hydrolase domain-like protein [Lentinula boryana]|uniref:NUDIX hydrolase domain-like protein n=1 Tax=Lentinula boryana TaxID=40481 RepID=A0ABQ8QL46_9AGAR|nr:NUDIX hydrolase domain-like protein [Lentinula boryana]